MGLLFDVVHFKRNQEKHTGKDLTLRFTKFREITDCLVTDGNLGNFSDGYHTFNELYHHRAILFSIICNNYKDLAWKSKLHNTGDMYDGMFIVGIDTPEGQARYHYDVDPYWDIFDVKELDKAPEWDGHSSSEAIERLRSLDKKY